MFPSAFLIQRQAARPWGTVIIEIFSILKTPVTPGHLIQKSPRTGFDTFGFRLHQIEHGVYFPFRSKHLSVMGHPLPCFDLAHAFRLRRSRAAGKRKGGDPNAPPSQVSPNTHQDNTKKPPRYAGRFNESLRGIQNFPVLRRNELRLIRKIIQMYCASGSMGNYRTVQPVLNIPFPTPCKVWFKKSRPGDRSGLS